MTPLITPHIESTLFGARGCISYPQPLTPLNVVVTWQPEGFASRAIAVAKLIVGTLVLALLLTAATGVNAEQVGTVQSGLSVKRATLWPGSAFVTEIPVCWENPGTDTQARQWTRDGASVWERVAAIRFTGWGTCASGDKGIRIQIISGNPHTTALGNEINGVNNGMALNFDFATWSTNCASTRQFCISAIAAHEFGHALGIAHEQNRSDRFDCTQEPQGEDGDWNVTPYDTHSIMNYCNPNWNGNGQLSDLDKMGIRVLYGKGPEPIEGTNPSVAYYEFQGSKQLETLFVSREGALGLTWKVNNGRWLGPVYISKPNFISRAAKIAMVNYPLNNQLEALYAAVDGAIYVSYKANNHAWSDPIRLTAPNMAPPGAQIAVAFYPLNNQLEALFVDNSGKVNVLWKAQNGAWHAPVGLTAPNVVPPGGGISMAYYPLNNQLEALFVDNNGKVNLLWKAQNGAWNAPVGLSAPNTAPPGAYTTVSYYPLNHQLEAFFIDNGGAISMVWKANNQAWSQPTKLSGSGVGMPGKAVASIYQPLNQQLEVFTIGRNGALQIVWKANNGAWAPLTSLSSPSAGGVGAGIGVQFQPLNNQLELFYSDQGGNLAFAWKAQNRAWAPARDF